MAARSVAGVVARVRSEARRRLGGLRSLVQRGELCKVCRRAPAVTLLRLAVPDPDAAMAIAKVDLAACALCEAKHAPRVLVSLSSRAARGLILEDGVEVDPYDRRIVGTDAPLTLQLGARS